MPLVERLGRRRTIPASLMQDRQDSLMEQGPKSLMLGLYRREDPSHPDQVGFVSILSRTDFPKEVIVPGLYVPPKPVLTMAVPVQWEEVLERHIDEQVRWKSSRRNFEENSGMDRDMIYVGAIWVRISNRSGKTLARTFNYYPKCYLNGDRERKRAKGLGYATEAAALLYLKDNNGVTHVRTTMIPSKSRRKQLKNVRIPRRRSMQVDTWVSRLQDGLERSLRKASEQNSG